MNVEMVMKKNLVALFGAGCLLLGMNCAADARETIVIAADPWCPHTCDVGAPQQGYMIDIAREAFAMYGIDVRYEVMPWSRAIAGVRKGKYTAIAGAATGDAADFIFPQEEQGQQSMELWTQKDATIQYTYVNSLDKLRIAAILDYSYGDAMDSYIQKHKDNAERVQLVGGEDALEQNIRKLNAGGVDAMPEDASVVQYFFASRKIPQNLVSVGRLSGDMTRKEDNVFVAFSPKNSESKTYAMLLTKAMQKLRETGRLKEILSRYGLKDWKVDSAVKP
jgi:polar amino acid transport system substrate-binding protein